MRVGIVGAGRVGTAVAVLMQRAGHTVIAVSGRGPTRDRVSRHLPSVPVREPAEVARAADLIMVTVPDDVIAPMVASVATQDGFHAGQWVAHMSGATGLDVLDPAREVGAHRLSVHPFQTFPDVSHAIDHLPGSTFAISADDDEGSVVAERVADDLLGDSFRLDEDVRPLYHAAAVFASNYLVALSSTAADLLRAVGVRDPVRTLSPLQQASLANVEAMGPLRALTGPAARGDAGTIERNLSALATHAPETVPAYVALARLTLDMAVRGDRLTPTQSEGVRDVLARWS